MEITMVNLIVAICMLAGVNIAFGSLDAIFDDNKTFDWKRFWNGIGKAVIIIAGVFGIYYAGTLVPDVIVMEIDGNAVNLTTALNMVGVAMFVWYGKQDIDKLMGLLKK